MSKNSVLVFVIGAAAAENSLTRRLDNYGNNCGLHQCAVYDSCIDENHEIQSSILPGYFGCEWVQCQFDEETQEANWQCPGNHVGPVCAAKRAAALAARGPKQATLGASQTDASDNYCGMDKCPIGDSCIGLGTEVQASDLPGYFDCEWVRCMMVPDHLMPQAGWTCPWSDNLGASPQTLGASPQTAKSGVGGPCGGEMSWDNPSPVYYCEPWLTCVGAVGTVEGTCENNSQHTSGVNGRCGNGQDGYFSCEPSLTCVGGDGAWYGACVVPKHYSDLGGQCGNGRDGYKTCQPWLTCVGGDGAWYGACEHPNQHIHNAMGRRRAEGAYCNWNQCARNEEFTDCVNLGATGLAADLPWANPGGCVAVECKMTGKGGTGIAEWQCASPPSHQPANCNWNQCARNVEFTDCVNLGATGLAADLPWANPGGCVAVECKMTGKGGTGIAQWQCASPDLGVAIPY